MRIELTHDVIAIKIWEQMPKRDKNLRMIRNSITQRVADYAEGKGSYLGEKELNAWKEFFPLLNLEEGQQSFIDKSRQKARRRRIWNRALIIGGAIILLSMFSAMAYALSAEIKSKEAIEARDEARESSGKLRASQLELANERYFNSCEKAKFALQNDDIIGALGFARDAKREIEKTVNALIDDDTKDSILQEFQIIVKEGQTADSLISFLSPLETVLPEYEKTLASGESKKEKMDFVGALRDFRRAQALINTETIRSKITELNSQGHAYYYALAIRHKESGTPIDIKYARIAARNAFQLQSDEKTRKLLNDL